MMRQLKYLSAVIVLTAAIAAGAYEVAVDKLEWRLTPYCNIIEDNGHKLLVVNVPPGVKDAGERNCAFAEIDMTPFQNQILEISVNFRGEQVKAAGERYPGVSLSFYFKNEATGEEYWPGIARVLGSFDWKRGAFSEDVPAGVTRGTLRIGIENATGVAVFDLGSLKIYTPDPLRKDLSRPLSPQAAAEIKEMKQRVVAALLTKPVESPERIQTILARQRADGSFDAIDYQDVNRSEWRTAKHLGETIALARAWAMPGQSNYHNQKLAEAVVKAVDYWSNHQFKNSNWWWNDMYVPLKMGEIMLLADPLFAEGPAREKALEVCRQSLLLNRYTGNNRVFVAANVFYRALLENNETALNIAGDTLAEEIRFAPVADKTDWSFGGIRYDGCYQQHGPQIQFGNYGAEFLANIAYWANIWKGTRRELTPAQWEVMRLLVFDGYRWVLWRGRIDTLAAGRQLSRNFAEIKGRNILLSIALLGQADPAGPERYQTLIDNNRAAINVFEGSRCFWNSDYLVYRRPDWYASVRMNSVRTTPMEDNVNWDNALGRYLADGVCLIVRSGDEYRDIAPCWDWTRLPGTTLPKTPIYTQEESTSVNLRSGGKTPRWTHSRQWRHLGTTSFTGGVTDGKLAVAVYSQNIDQVSAKKAYFFGDKAIWELTCDITSASSFAVGTTVNSCLLNGEVKQGEGWVWHDNIGYRGDRLQLQTGPRTGDWRYLEGGMVEPLPVTKDLFTLTFEHGVGPQQSSCEVLILPGATAAETAAENASKILVNTGKVQAVVWADGTVAAVFYAPGKLGNFVCNAPGVFLIGKNKVYAADPTALLSSITLTLDGVSKTVELPQGELAGSGVAVKF